MAEYLESLGKGATLQAVFDDLYGQAEALVNDLDRQRATEYGEGSNQVLVPGTDLEMRWGCVEGPQEGSYYSTSLIASSGLAANYLAGMIYYKKTEDDISERVKVQGFRNGTGFDADYCLTRRVETGMIVCKLGTIGLCGQPPSDEPIGEIARDPRMLVGDLTEPDQRRLEIVTTGILENLTIVELIRDGTSAKEALDAAGKVLIGR